MELGCQLQGYEVLTTYPGAPSFGANSSCLQVWLNSRLWFGGCQ
jgi:hypothetical protein